MGDFIQKTSCADKQIPLTRQWSIGLGYLLSLSSISAGTLATFSTAAFGGVGAAQAQPSVPPVAFPDRTLEKGRSLALDFPPSEENCSAQAPPSGGKDATETDKADIQNFGELTDCGQPATLWDFEPTEAFVPQTTIQFPAWVQSSFPQGAGLTPAMASSLAQSTEVDQRRETTVTESVIPTSVGKERSPASSESIALPTIDELVVQEGGANLLVQTSEPEARERSQILEEPDPLSPTLDVQGVYLYQDESSARARLRGIYPVSPNALFGAIVDLATGDDFAGTEGDGFSLSELYFAGSLPEYPELRLVVGLMDLTSYFDRNSFAKDNTTHFFHPLFQTNPALAASGVGSRPGALLNWNITDNIEAKAVAFSSNRNIGDWDLDAFAGEVGFRAGNAIVRATYATNEDTGRDGVFGTREGDREHAFGINAEVFVPELNLGLFARYGRLENSDRDDGADTYNVGLNFLDLFMPEDRLGFGYAYGPSFSEDDDVWEIFYDTRLTTNLRAGVALQARDEFSDVVFGFRVRTDWSLFP